MPVSRSLPSRQRSYRRRIKISRCRSKPQPACNRMRSCKFVSTSKRQYCRKKRNVSTRKLTKKQRALWKKTLANK